MSNQNPQKPRPKKPQSKPIQNAPFYVDRTAEKIRRWKLAAFCCLIFGVLSTLCWLAVRTGDITPRLAGPIIFIFHAICGGSVAYAWLKK